MTPAPSNTPGLLPVTSCSSPRSESPSTARAGGRVSTREAPPEQTTVPSPAFTDTELSGNPSSPRNRDPELTIELSDQDTTPTPSTVLKSNDVPILTNATQGDFQFTFAVPPPSSNVGFLGAARNFLTAISPWSLQRPIEQGDVVSNIGRACITNI